MDIIHSSLPLLSDEPLARFARMVDTSLEHDGRRGYVALREDLCRYIGRERESAWQAWARLTDAERSCFALCVAQGLSQRETARALGMSQATVCRRLQAVSAALADARG